ncbi:MAG: sulfotransferase, partial [Candidatus Limnocylindrales bacterium]
MAAHPGYRWMAAANETWWSAASYNRYYERIVATDAPLEAYEQLWARRFLRIRDEAARLKPGTYEEFRFEDLVANPQAIVAQMCEFVGLPFERDWLPVAAELIDGNRPRERQPGWSAQEMAGAPGALMVELGYVDREGRAI